MGRLGDFFKAKQTQKRADLESEIAYPVQYSRRTPWSDFSIVQNLTSERLACILASVRNGEDPEAYLILAQDIELKDLHYRSVLGTRKDAVCGLNIKIEPAGEDARAKEIAQAVKLDIIESPTLKIRSLIRDMMDALGKGFSVNELIWEATGTRWKPKSYLFRHPQWFRYDEIDGRTLKLRSPDGLELSDLVPYKFIIHEPHLISGSQITSGFAFIALFVWMIKQYNITSWAAFIDRYGYPIRLGKYGKKSTPEDITTLKRAVASIGSDFGAVIPSDAILEIIESHQVGNASEIYEKLCIFIDKQVSKLIVGQTMTTDEGGSLAQSKTHEKVREDIADSDIQQLTETLNSQLLEPYVRFNFGEQNSYPKIKLHKPDIQNIEQIISAVEKLGAQGLEVKADEIRNLLGLSHPAKTDSLIGGRPQSADETFLNHAKTDLNAQNLKTANNTDVETILNDEETQEGWVEITDEIANVLEQAADKATDFESFQGELEKLVSSWKPDDIAKTMAIAFFKARSVGDTTFDKDEQ